MRIVFLVLLIPLACFSVSPKEIAQVEVKAWKAYYAKDPVGVMSQLRLLLFYQYPGLNGWVLERVSGQFASAIMAFRRIPAKSGYSRYRREVYPLLQEGYRLLGQTIEASWNPDRVAEADMDWWIARRDEATNKPSQVGEKIALFYQLISGAEDPKPFMRAGYLRAAAARFRDLCEHQWGGVTENDWQVIQSLLEESYETILQNQST